MLNAFEKLYNTTEIVQFLKEEIESVNLTSENHFRTRFLQFVSSHEKILKYFINVLGGDVKMEDANGDTMLALMDYSTSKEIFDIMISAGADVNHQNKQKNTPLILATEMTIVDDNCQKIQAKLIDAGASVTIKNCWNLAPVDLDPTLKRFIK